MLLVNKHAMLSHKHRFIFIHIPKTGGTSIERVFCANANKKNVKNKHAKFCEFKNDKNYFSFSFVRNPWDLTVSMYKYMWTSSFSWPVRWRKLHEEFSKLSFSDWVNHDYFQGPTIRSVDIACQKGSGSLQYDWIKSKGKNIDFIGRFESLQEDFDVICDKIGIPHQKLPHVNKSKHKHYTEYYDDETREIVAQKHARDIEYFGYRFGE